MTGLCGWSGAFKGAATPEGMLRGMALGLPSPPGAESRARAEAGVALHVQGWTGRSDLDVEGGLWAAIEGFPRWTSPELAGLAAERGHGAALREAYRRHGADLFRHLAGPFSLAVIEPDSGRALLAVDRFGAHAMYYARLPGGALAFGSTADAVRAHPAVGATISAQEIYDYLFFYVCPAPKTVYREQRKLLPAQYLQLDNGQVRTAFYWRMPYGTERAAEPAGAPGELESLIERSVRQAIEDENPDQIGAFLSGGLDSSTLVGLLARSSGGRPKTFTVRFEHDAYDESGYARAAARHFGTDHHEYTLTPKDVLDLVPKIAETYDEPFGNSSAVPAYYCARMASEHGVGLMLAGDGGDELFAGNARYVEQMIFDLYRRVPAAVRSYVIEPGVFGVPFADRMRLVRRARNYITRARMPMPDRLEDHNLWLSVPLDEVFEDPPLREIDPDEPLELRREVYRRAGSASLLQCMMHLDLTAALADNDLRKVNRMCGLAGVRVRYPFLSEDVAEFSARVPASLLIKRLKIRDFYKRELRHFLPAETLSKRKHGFGMPFSEWLKEDPGLRDLAHDSLLAFKRRHCMKAAFIDRVIAGHRAASQAVYDEIVWDIMMLELWWQAHADPAAARVARAGP